MRKGLGIIILLTAFTLTGCAGFSAILNQDQVINPVEAVSQNLDPIVETLSDDWLKASGFIRGMVGVSNLPKYIVDQLDEIDGWFKDADGEWLPAECVKLNTFQKWYIAGVRVGHTGPVLQALIQKFAPGLLSLPEVITGLAFLGLGM